MSEAHAAASRTDMQGGGTPFAVGLKKFGMWLFIVSDSLTFSALLIAYSYVRAANDWPTPFHFFPSIVFATVMTLFLLSSSLTMVYGVPRRITARGGPPSNGFGPRRCWERSSWRCTPTSGCT